MSDQPEIQDFDGSEDELEWYKRKLIRARKDNKQLARLIGTQLLYIHQICCKLGISGEERRAMQRAADHQYEWWHKNLPELSEVAKPQDRS